MEPEGFLLFSEEPLTRPYKEPDEFNPYSSRSSLILSSYFIGILPSGLPTKIILSLLISPICATCPVRIILITKTILNLKMAVFWAVVPCNLVEG